MKSHSMPLLLATLLVMTPLEGQAQNGPWLKASVPYVSLRVQLSSNYAGAPKLIEEFSSNDPINHSVFCLSSFFDVKYQLRDSSNSLITPDSKPWEHGTDAIQGGGGSIPGAPDPCKTVKVARITKSVLLSYFYPNLPRGVYTLQITLAPRGQTARAALAPLSIKI